jgi:hypothetical protein
MHSFIERHLEDKIIAPVPEPYPLWKNVQVLSIADFIRVFSG